MPLRIFGLWCLVIGHRRDASSRRNDNGSIFGTCQTCGREMFREPVKGKWRIASDNDRRPRGIDLLADQPDVIVTGKRSRRSRR